MKRLVKLGAEALLLGVWSLLLGFVITVLVSPLLWLLSLVVSGESNTLPWSLGVMFRNYIAMLSYLILPWIGSLNFPDFPSSASALSHFAEVKQWFMIAFLVWLLLTPFVYFWVKKWRQNNITLTIHYLLDGLMIAPVLIALLALFNFDAWFVGFHHLLFNNNDWLFDPATDPIILILPEYFFALCAFMVIGIDSLAIFLIKRHLSSRSSLRINVSND